jgi:Flp pilus assembly protein TadG
MTRFQDSARQGCRRQKKQRYSSPADAAPTLGKAGCQGVKTRAQQRGAAVVEFALILPILLALLVGGIDMSLALYDKAVITNASREGARAGIVARNPPVSHQDILDVVNAYAKPALVSLGTPAVDPTVLIQNVTRPGSDPALRVTVSYTFQGIGLGSLFESLGKPWVLQASTVMVYE